MVRIPMAKPGARINEKTMSDHCNDSGTRVLTINYHQPPPTMQNSTLRVPAIGPTMHISVPPPHQAPRIH
ncbi:hypothetical protein BJV77DRAFT_1022677, partial [Russula vinacea]